MKLALALIAMSLVASSAFGTTILNEGRTVLEIDNHGCPVRLQNDSRTIVNNCAQGIGRIILGAQSIPLVSSLSISKTDHAIGVAYGVATNPSFILAIGYSLIDQNGESTLVRQVSIRRVDGRKGP